jgi:hypothetical protein
LLERDVVILERKFLILSCWSCKWETLLYINDQHLARISDVDCLLLQYWLL